MDYEKEEERLQRLFEEADSDIQYDDEESDNEEDITETRKENSDTEQEGESSEEENVPKKRYKSSYFSGRDKSTKWDKHCPLKRVCTQQTNLTMNIPRVANCAKQAASILDTWKLFFPDEMLAIIVENTNKYISQIADNHSRERDARPTDSVEIKAVLGLLYMCGFLKSSRLNIGDLWDKSGCGVERFGLTMSKR